MKLTLKTRFKAEEYTIGSLLIDGEYFCDTLEDKVRVLNSASDKIFGKTAIPAGTYKVVVNYSPKFKRRLPRLLDVPYFEGILIHRGNEAEHTHGCILVGENKVKGRVINSAQWERALIQILLDAIADDEEITIDVIR